MNIVRQGLFLMLLTFGAHNAFAAPGAAALIAPSGDVVGTTLAFSWQAVPESTWYLFWLGKGAPPSFVMQQWYSAEQAGCANGGTCTITITPPVNAGSHVWFIQTWGAGATGPWSTGMTFVVKDPVQNWSSALPDARRFTLVLNNEGVLDNETGVVWQRSPQVIGLKWQDAIAYCTNATTGGRRGWRAPTLSELTSLVDINRTDPSLPGGHPFTGITFVYYWTQNPAVFASNVYYAVEFSAGHFILTFNDPLALHRPWCVRAGSAGVY